MSPLYPAMWGVIVLAYVVGFLFAYRQIRLWPGVMRWQGHPRGATALVLLWLVLGGMMAQPWQQLFILVGRLVELGTTPNGIREAPQFTFWGEAPFWVYPLLSALLLVGVYAWVIWQIREILRSVPRDSLLARKWEEMRPLDRTTVLLTVAALVYDVVNALQQLVLSPPFRGPFLSRDISGYIVGWVVLLALWGLLLRFLRGHVCRWSGSQRE